MEVFTLKNTLNLILYIRNFIFIVFVSMLPAKAQAFEMGRSVDRGGRISEYVGRIVSEAARRHVIDGDCMSACTMWLGHRGTCVTPEAVLWFHAATEYVQTVSADRTWRAVSIAGNRALLAMYPARLRAVVGPWLASSEFHTLTGLQLATLGVPLCPSEDVIGRVQPQPVRIQRLMASAR